MKVKVTHVVFAAPTPFVGGSAWIEKSPSGSVKSADYDTVERLLTLYGDQKYRVPVEQVKTMIFGPTLANPKPDDD